MKINAVFKPENSIIAGLATIALVGATYQLDVGPVSQVHASDANFGANSAGIKKAGYTSLVLVAGITLLARDPNILILGGAAIIAFHSHYRHADLVNPATNMVEDAGPSAYQPAGPGTPMQAVA